MAPPLPGPGNLTPEAILRCFARARLPAPARRGRGDPEEGLVALADRYDAFILDGYGVVNVGAEPVPGIVDAVEALHRAGRAVMVLTNGAGRPVRWTARRYAEWGVGVPEHFVVSSRDALEAELVASPRPGLWGVMAKPGSELETLPAATALLGDDDALYREADGFILLRSGAWTVERHRRMVEALRRAPRPVLVANPDVSAPYPDGSFSTEPGYWALRLEAEAPVRCERFGKPFAHAFDLALARLGAVGRRRDRVAMVGDGLYTDILGGLAAGLGTVLVTDHGLVKDLDWRAWAQRTGICPDHVIPGP